MQPYAADDEEPPGTLQPLLAPSLPQLRALRVPICPRGFPGLLPLAIADRIAQYQHGIDVVSTPAHARAFETDFDDEFVGAFHAA